jgi:hypothetical protein
MGANAHLTVSLSGCRLELAVVATAAPAEAAVSVLARPLPRAVRARRGTLGRHRFDCPGRSRVAVRGHAV